MSPDERGLESMTLRAPSSSRADVPKRRKWTRWTSGRCSGTRMRVILTLATPAGRMSGPGFVGHGVACAGIEALTRLLAGELGDYGVRVVCIRSHPIPETVTKGSHARHVFGEVAARGGTTVDAMLAGAANGTLLKRLPTLDELASTAVFLASAHAGAMTGAIANLTCGMTLD
jgi:3-oxoacyl-[acyl-carrier protein] reductase